MIDHAGRLAAWFGEEHAMRGFRKHAGWYTKGFRGGARLRTALMEVKTLGDLRAIAAEIDRELPFPPSAMRVPRGKTSGTQKVVLPAGYLDDLDDLTPPGAEAEDATSGG